MNDKKTDDALQEIFETLGESNEGIVEGGDIAAGSEMGASIGEFPEGLDQVGEEGLAELIGETGIEGLEEFQESPVGAPAAEEIEEVGTNWLALLWLGIAVVSAVALVYTQVTDVIHAESRARLERSSSELDFQSRDMGYQALLATSGNTESFAKISSLKDGINNSLAQLTGADGESGADSLPGISGNTLAEIQGIWEQVQVEVDILLNNQNAIDMTVGEVAMVNELTPQLLAKTDELVEQLIQDGASLELINLASRQRFLTQRIKASINEFASGAPGWEVAATQFGQDVKLFGEINDSIRLRGGPAISDAANEVELAYQELINSADGVMNNVGDYFSLRNASSNVVSSSASLSELTRSLHIEVTGHSDAPGIAQLPYVLGGITFVSLLLLFWSIYSHSKKSGEVQAQRTQVSEDAVIKLLDEMGDLAQGDLTVEAEVTDEVTGAIADSINFAIGEMRGLVKGISGAAEEMNSATESTESLIAQLLSSSDVQSQEIENAASEVKEMTEAINRMNKSATRSTEQARVSAEVAQNGANAVRNTVRGMTTTRNQIQETAKQLKRLGESSQQINEIVNLIQDVAEQTNVLSLNASIQAAMAGEAGRGFAVVAQEVQRLADRSARASNEITELVKNIQQDANSAITSMEATTEEVVSGATTADEAGKALNEIEAMSQNLLKTIDQVAEDARNESRVAQTVAERMTALLSSTAESDLNVSQVAVAMEQMRTVAEQLNQSISGFKLPG